MTLQKLDKFKEALSLAQEIFERRKVLNGLEHMQTLAAQSIMAQTMQSIGQIADAREMWIELMNQADRNSSLPKQLRVELLVGAALNIELLTNATLDDCNRSIELSKKAVELEPTNIESWRTLGRVYVVSEEWSEALEAFNKVVEMGHKGELIPKPVLERIVKLDLADENYQQLMDLVRKTVTENN